MKGDFSKLWPCEKQEVSSRGAASTILLCQELGSRSVVISPHVQVHTNTARSLEILEEAVLSVEKNNLINYMENQLVYPKYCCSPSHNII